jgi:16S rRNA (uracil1498-N3)-methyltransferase
MARFFAEKSDIHSDTIFIKGDDAQHIKKVLRMAPGEQFTVCDGDSTDYLVEITGFEQSTVLTRVISSCPNKTEPPVNITLYQGLPKSDKMDYIIQKSTELGVSRVIPVLNDRTVVKLHTGRDAETKLARWRKIAEEAAKQCQRGRIPAVGEPCTFKDAINKAVKEGLALIPYENEQNTGLKSVLRNRESVLRNRESGNVSGNGGKGNISIFIGPEGGFSDNEFQIAVKAGILSVSLDPRILRTETAGIAVIAILMYELGDIG